MSRFLRHRPSGLHRAGAGAADRLAKTRAGVVVAVVLARTARGWGATEGGSGVLHEGPGLVQYAQPPASATPPSCSTGRPGAGVSRNLEPAFIHGLRAPAQEPQGGGPAGQGTADPRPGAPGPATTTPQSRSVPRLSVHGADINGPNRQRAQRESLECCGFSSARIAGAGLMSALWTPTPHQAASKWPTPASSTTNPPRSPARASISETMTLTCLRNEETRQSPGPSWSTPTCRPVGPEVRAVARLGPPVGGAGWSGALRGRGARVSISVAKGLPHPDSTDDNVRIMQFSVTGSFALGQPTPCLRRHDIRSSQNS